jgi:hypothetical protein
MRRLRWLLLFAVLLASCGQPSPIEPGSSIGDDPPPPEPTLAPPLTPTADAVWLDVTAWMGRTPAEVAEVFGPATSARSCVPGALLSAPSGGEIREYKRPWGGFSATFEQGETAGFTVYFVKQKPRGHDDALRVLNLPVGQPPSERPTPSVRRWENLSGYTVAMTAESAPSSEVILQVQVRRPVQVQVPLPKVADPSCTALPE